MNSIFKRWVKEEAFSRTDEFTSKMVLEKIVDKRGTSPYIGDAAAIGWYLSRLEGITKVKEGLYKVAIQ
jgi:hypothetical protein